jgi:hypothetical protein
VERDPIYDLKSVIRTLVDVAHATRARYAAQQPNRGSPAATELEEEKSYRHRPNQRPVLDCYTGALFRVFVAEEDLRSIARLLEEPLPVYGPAALLRTIMEVSSRAWWAFEPGIGTRRRVVRGYIDRVASLVESSRIRTGAATEEEELVRAKSLERLEEVRRSAMILGFDIKFDRRGGLLSAADEPAPRQTELIRRQLDYTGEASYKLLSGIAHGVLFAMMWRTKPVEGGPQFECGEVRTPTPEFSDLLTDAGFALLSYREAVDRHYRLFGWDRTEWDSAWHESKRVMARLFHESKRLS